VSSIWLAASYGYAPVYWLQVAGIPTIFIESALGLTLPSGWTAEDASLVIDDSAEVGTERIDREKGIGTGMAMTCKLLDTAAVRATMRKWTYSAQLTADLGHSDTTAHIANTTGWPASGTFYAGLEAVTYSSKTGTTFAGLTRGAVGTLATTHRVGTTGQILTDWPRYWQGRQVTLWASFVDPAGTVTGAALTTEAIQVWAGRIEAPPERRTDGFELSCKALDRILDDQLGAKISAAVTANADSIALANTGESAILSVAGYDSSNAKIWGAALHLSPFDGLTQGTPTAASVLRQAVSDTWAAEVTDKSLTASLGEWRWSQKGAVWRPSIELLADASTRRVRIIVYVNAIQQAPFIETVFPSGVLAIEDLQLQASTYDVLFPGAANPGLAALSLELDDPGATVPATGVVALSAGSGDTAAYSYAYSATAGNAVLLAGLTLVDGQAGVQGDPSKADKAEIRYSDPGGLGTDTLRNLALRCLQSSGTGLRGAYDTLAATQGYGLQSVLVDDDSFALLTDAPAGGLKAQATAAERSFVDLFGGMLGLFRLAVVAKPGTDTNEAIAVRLISTAPGGAPSAFITDSDLLSHNEDPVTSITRLRSPNAIEIEVTPPGLGSESLKLVYNDMASIEAQGRNVLQVSVQGVARADLAAALTPIVGGQFAFDPSLQAAELLVHPSVAAEVGDSIWLTTTHPAVWAWSSAGAPGYDGPAIVVGRSLNLANLQTRLVVLLDGSVTLHPLCPAAEVSAFDDATNPTWIEVSLSYLGTFAVTIARAGGAIPVIHYQPGQAESTGTRYTISAAAQVGSACRLTVASKTGVHVLDTSRRSTLTWAHTAVATDWQKTFAHADDGANWA